ncbi:acyltransferase [Dasania sp. GY-MA-18]|uniref:Acyltransferase n=1 Tax=Dasania phycosphaerae TaxID=2950436 RepID=A0A9J6RQP2_9GAMM|nr:MULTISPECIES: acyltransferase [Dasania]MCR8924109.1 acyltransferase [Dasania sp. GY-MA-18]MCZ0866682.1 acyltransferase [Dasania phycosphaerae]MCZ0870267.1 acyltransferase [Dasania phycosphaerae]
MLKRIINLMFFLVVIPLLALFVLLGLVFNKKSLFIGFSQFLSLIPGKFGSYLRKAFYRVVIKSCGESCVIGFATLLSDADIVIEEGVYIGPQCNIGKSHIAKNCLLGSGVHILSGKSQHDFSRLDVPIQQQGGSYQKVFIGEDSWIGNGAIVMANIGRQCVVAAGAVVVNDVADFSVVAGNPAKLIKLRTENC